MPFMKPQAEHMHMWHVETTCGTALIPAELLSDNFDADEAAQYVEGKIYDNQEPELKKGWYCRLSASGYMDCTDWNGPYETYEEAIAACCEEHDCDENGDPIDE